MGFTNERGSCDVIGHVLTQEVHVQGSIWRQNHVNGPSSQGVWSPVACVHRGTLRFDLLHLIVHVCEDLGHRAGVLSSENSSVTRRENKHQQCSRYHGLVTSQGLGKVVCGRELCNRGRSDKLGCDSGDSHPVFCRAELGQYVRGTELARISGQLGGSLLWRLIVNSKCLGFEDYRVY